MNLTTSEYAPELGIYFHRMSTLSKGLYYLDHPADSEQEAVSGSTLSVHYTGYHPDGSVFDNSRERAPFPLLLEKAQVTSEWDPGIVGN